MSKAKTIEELTMEVALREREKRLEEIKLAKSKESTVDPRLLVYQQKVNLFYV